MVFNRGKAKEVIGRSAGIIEKVLTGTVEGGLELDAKVKGALRVAWCGLELAVSMLEATEIGGRIELVEARRKKLLEAVERL